jgi:MoaA/NifB/PqqE/SkfB family radical SAM enzyme
MVMRLADELPKLGTREVVLTGEGEPFMHPLLVHIIAAFKQRGLKVQLFTNGTLIGKNMIRSILDSGLDVLKVSLWASSPEEYAKCHSSRDTSLFSQLLEDTSSFSSAKRKGEYEQPLLLLHHVLNVHTYQSVGKKIELARNTGCDGVVFSPFAHWRDECAAEALVPDQIERLCRDLTLAKHQMRIHNLQHNIDEVLLKFRLGETAWRDLLCYTGWYQARIRVDGTVMPCATCFLPMWSLRENSFVEIWNGESYRQFRRKSTDKKQSTLLATCCYCDWCCTVLDNYHIHRRFKWLAPFCHKG